MANRPKKTAETPRNSLFVGTVPKTRLILGATLFILFFLVSVSSCGLSREILGLSRKEAVDRLKEGDLAFILEAELPAEFPAALARLEALARLNPDALFYAGLLAEDRPHQPGEKTDLSLVLFALALKSDSAPIRRESAEKLILPCLQAKETAFVREVLARLPAPKKGVSPSSPELSLKAACLYRLGRFEECAKVEQGEETAWNRILPLIGAWRHERGTKVRELKDFFFDSPLDGTLSDSAWEWAFAEIKRVDPGFFGPGEGLLLEGRAMVARSSYGQGLRFFRQVLEEESEYPREDYFFPYPELISSLGRAFQFTPRAQAEGAGLFNEWIDALEEGSSGASRYRLLYFAGRIERQRERYKASSARFMEAAEAAPDNFQRDACIWYVLRNTLTDDPESAAALVKELLPLMSSPSYFTDIMDRLSRQLAHTGQWDTMLEIFKAIKQDHHAAASQYAWILGRAIQEGRFKPEPQTEGLPSNPDDFFRIAFEEGSGTLYYRAMSASQLKIPLIPAPEAKTSRSERAPAPSRQLRQEVKFIHDFFEYSAGGFVLPYLKKIEDELPVPELRKAAAALGVYGNRVESLNLVSRYIDRDDYELDLEDLYLYYPRHFLEIIEKNAQRAGFGAEILFGLIRTESAFMPGIASRVGAIGLGQFMPDTALEMAGRIARSGGEDYRNGGQVDLTNPEINAHLSAYYLRYLIDSVGSPMSALLAYNGGIGRVRRWRNAAPALPEDLFLETIEYPETREYGRRVLAAAAMYGWLYYDMSMEAVVADIYR